MFEPLLPLLFEKVSSSWISTGSHRTLHYKFLQQMFLHEDWFASWSHLKFYPVGRSPDAVSVIKAGRASWVPGSARLVEMRAADTFFFSYYYTCYYYTYSCYFSDISLSNTATILFSAQLVFQVWCKRWWVRAMFFLKKKLSSLIIMHISSVKKNEIANWIASKSH